MRQVKGAAAVVVFLSLLVGALPPFQVYLCGALLLAYSIALYRSVRTW